MSVAAVANTSLYLSSDTLLEAVEAVGVVCENERQASYDSCIFLDYVDGTLTVAATNIRKKVWAEVNIPVPSWGCREGQGFRDVAVHRTELLKALRGRAGHRMLMKGENALIIKTYDRISKLDIKPYSRDEVPVLKPEAATWERADLVPNLRTALRFVASEPSNAYREALTGVLFDNEYIVGCDIIQLVRCKTIDVGRQFIIPSLGAAAICGLFQPAEKIKMTVDNNTAVFETPDRKVACQFLAAKYPDWRRVFPSKPSSVCRVSARGLLTRIAALAVSAVTEWITLTGSDTCHTIKLSYHAKAYQRVPLWTAVQQARVHGSFDVSVRVCYLKNILACFNRPVVKYYRRVAPLEFVEGDTTCLVMPVA